MVDDATIKDWQKVILITFSTIGIAMDYDPKEDMDKICLMLEACKRNLSKLHKQIGDSIQDKALLDAH